MGFEDLVIPSRENPDSDYESYAEMYPPSEEHSVYSDEGVAMRSGSKEDTVDVEVDDGYNGFNDEDGDGNISATFPAWAAPIRETIQYGMYAGITKYGAADLVSDHEAGNDGEVIIDLVSDDGHSMAEAENKETIFESMEVRNIISINTPDQEHHVHSDQWGGISPNWKASTHSYNDSHEYYEREDAEYRRRKEKLVWDEEKEKEREVQNALFILEAAKKMEHTFPISPIDDGIWDLYSTQYFLRCPPGSRRANSIQSGRLWQGFPEFACSSDEIACSISIYPEARLKVFPFVAPELASMEPILLDSVQGHITEVMFLGSGYLKLRVEANIINGEKPTARKQGEPPNDVIEFSGIFQRREERIRLREEQVRSFPKFYVSI